MADFLVKILLETSQPIPEFFKDRVPEGARVEFDDDSAAEDDDDAAAGGDDGDGAWGSGGAAEGGDSADAGGDAWATGTNGAAESSTSW
jgi:hypothetical protein